MVPRNLGFEGWNCSANHFFLHANSVYGEYYTNKDCRVKLDQTRGPIATIDTMPEYISYVRQHLLSNTLPVMRCVQKVCLCGTCAPKSIHKENLENIMNIYNLQASVDK